MYAHMKHLSIMNSLELAAIHDEKRDHYLYEALHLFSKEDTIIGTAFIRPSSNPVEALSIISAGKRKKDIHR